MRSDLFLFRRIDPGRFAHIGGVGRGVGWAGIVEVGVYDEPFVAESLRTGSVVRRYVGEPWHVFGPYYGMAVAIVPVDDDLFAVFGSTDESLLRVNDADLRELAGFASQSLSGVIAAKRLADELEVVNAVRDLLRAPGASFDEALQSIVAQAATSLSCEVGVLYAREHGKVAVFDPTGILAGRERCAHGRDGGDRGARQHPALHPGRRAERAAVPAVDGRRGRVLLPARIRRAGDRGPARRAHDGRAARLHPAVPVTRPAPRRGGGAAAHDGSVA